MIISLKSGVYVMIYLHFAYLNYLNIGIYLEFGI